MSIIDTCTVTSCRPLETQKIGLSLAHSLYKRPVSIRLSGDLGAGKTTVVQGLAQGLNIAERVVSPSYALMQQYDTILLHIDLYRLKPHEVTDILQASEDFPGIRIIEWPSRAPTHLLSHRAGIVISIDEIHRTTRSIRIEFYDMAIPSSAQIKKWYKQLGVPKHIIGHMRAVTKVTEQCAKRLIKRGTVVRTKAVLAAALCHDMLKFVNFKTFTGDQFYTPSKPQAATWKKLQQKYGRGHEQAVEKFLIEHGYPGIAEIVATHGMWIETGRPPVTTEQKILAYSDKRVAHENIVSLKERFAEFARRHGKTSLSPEIRKWKRKVYALEKELFK